MACVGGPGIQRRHHYLDQTMAERWRQINRDGVLRIGKKFAYRFHGLLLLLEMVREIGDAHIMLITAGN